MSQLACVSGLFVFYAKQNTSWDGIKLIQRPLTCDRHAHGYNCDKQDLQIESPDIQMKRYMKAIALSLSAILLIFIALNPLLTDLLDVPSPEKREAQAFIPVHPYWRKI